MTTTFKLKVDGDKVVIDSVEDVAESFDDIVEKADRVNVELDKQGRKYSDLREDMRKLEKQSDKTFGRKGGGSGAGGGGGTGMLGKVGAVAVGLFAMKESIVAAREAIRSLAESGNKDMQQLNAQIVQVEGAFGDLFATVARSRFLDLNNMAQNSAFILDKINGITQGLSAIEVATKRDIQNREFILGQVDEQLAKTKRAGELQKLSLADARAEAATIRETLNSKENLRLTQEELVTLSTELLSLETRITQQAKEQLDFFEKRKQGEKRSLRFQADQEDRAQTRQQRIERFGLEQRNKEREEARKLWEEQRNADEEASKLRQNAIIRENRFRRAQEMQAHEQRLQMIKDEQKAKRDSLRESFGQDGGPAGQLLGQQSPLDVLRKMGERRGGTAKDMHDVGKEFRKFMQGPGRGQSPAEFAKFQAEFAAEAKRAYEANAAQTINSLRKSGKLTQEQTRALAEATKELIDQQDEQQKQAREIANVRRELSALASKGRSSRARSGTR